MVFQLESLGKTRNKIVFVFLFLWSSGFCQIINNYGLSRPCQRNIICEPFWCNEKRAVVVMAFEHQDTIYPFCTGFLINNEKFDGRNFLMTADHCRNDSLIQNESVMENLVLVFNYESDNCFIPSNGFDILRTKATVLASTDIQGSDFLLLELEKKVPLKYTPYYVGWTNSADKPNPETGAMIHHPRGDIKKYSEFSRINTKSSNKRYWYIKKFDFGGVETSSSGAPLFDSQKKCIGHSSSANTSNDICDNENNEARFGKFSESWNGYSTNNNQLQHWLNPNGTEEIYIGSISGFEPCRGNYFFEDADDLHTSENVNGMPGGVGLLPGSRSYNGVYSASSSIVTGQGVTILSNTSVEFQANSIVLGEGLIVQPESNFIAQHKPCSVPCENEENENNLEERRAMVNNSNKFNNTEDQTLINIEYKTFPQVFPNPTNNYFTLKNNNVERTIVIYSSEGQIMFNSNLKQNEDLKISTNEFGKGIFFIQSSSNSGAIQTQKLIVY